MVSVNLPKMMKPAMLIEEMAKIDRRPKKEME
jgi:hypothetical protein